MNERWLNQEEAFQFAINHPSCMLDMDMGTGKTRVAIDVAMELPDVCRILIVCPKAVIPVWRENLEKFRSGENWELWDRQTGTVAKKAEDLQHWLKSRTETFERATEPKWKQFVVINYDSVWRKELGDLVYKRAGFDMIILDESHRAKSAGSKVSKYLAMVGKQTRYKMCLSGTPMANSPLDVYGQYRFLDPTIFGTRHDLFLQKYAVMGGPDLKFIVGFKNQQELNSRFNSIAYHCKMSDIADRIKLPNALPPIKEIVELPSKDMKVMKDLSKDFIAECNNGHIVINNVLVKLLRLQQICSGFCYTQESVFDDAEIQELNTVKEDVLAEMLMDIGENENVVVFCNFKHDLEAVHRAAIKNGRKCFELSGSENTLDDWKQTDGAVIAVQIQAGAEGVDMTKSNYAIYFSIPHSLAMYNQSKARLYRPGQTRPVVFKHLIAKDTIDEAMYKSLMKKQDIVQSIKQGTFDFGYVH